MSSQALDQFLKSNIEDQKTKGLYNVIDTLQGANGPVIRIDGKSLINLSSNNYLGLATDPRLIDASVKASQTYGTGAGAVRTNNGTMDLHIELEEKLARFKKTEAVILLFKITELINVFRMSKSVHVRSAHFFLD